MISLMRRAWAEDDGVLTFEWVLLVSVLVLGVIGGLSAVRDAIVDELGDVCQALMGLDQSYTILPPLDIQVHGGPCQGASNANFIDAAVFWGDCNRNEAFSGQTGNPLLDFDAPA